LAALVVILLTRLPAAKGNDDDSIDRLGPELWGLKSSEMKAVAESAAELKA